MSYSCEISFKHVESVEELFSFLTKFKKACVDSAEEIIKHNIYFSPLALGKCTSEDFNNVVLPERKEIKDNKAWDRKLRETENWIKNIFTFRWTYIEKWKLLAVYSVSDHVCDMFDGRVYFQNSCDQDYDFEDWEGIKEFEELYNTVINMPIDAFESTYFEAEKQSIKDYYGDMDYEDAKNEDPSFTYLRKNYVYDVIWKELESSLYDDNSVTYLTIFGSIYDTMLYPAALKAREYMRELWLGYKKEKENDRADQDN